MTERQRQRAQERLEDDFIKAWVRHDDPPLRWDDHPIEWWRRHHPRRDTFLEMNGFYGRV
jgi:hypothetical protein